MVSLLFAHKWLENLDTLSYFRRLRFLNHTVKSVGHGGLEPPTIGKLLMRIPVHLLLKRELPPSLAGDNPLAWT